MSEENNNSGVNMKKDDSEVILIAAISENNGIGFKGEIPWYISEDFKRFKELTLGNPCVMGDITYYTLPDNARPLPGRENIILTLNKDFSEPGTVHFHDVKEALDYARTRSKKVYVTGGGTIYRLCMPFADKLEITHVHKTVEADAFFPEIDLDVWKEVARDDREGYSFVTYVRK